MEDVRCAEEALVATLVLAPHRLGDVASWLHRSDFGTPACGLLYERVREVAARGADPRGAGLLDALRACGELRSDGYPISALTRWFDAVPPRPDVGVYGALVVEGALGRQLQATGTRLVQVAGRTEPTRALIASVTARATLAAARRRWCQLPAEVRATTGAPRIAVQTGTSRSERAAASAHLDARDDYAEIVTVGSLLTAPHLVSRLPWLRARDFTSPDCGRAFDAIASMTEASMTVDRVTLAGELRRRGAVSATGDWDPVLRKAEASVPVPTAVSFYARQVLDAAVVDQVGAAGRRLVELGCGRPGGADAMFRAALAELDGLNDVHRRLQRSRVVRAPRPMVTERTAVRVAARQVADRTVR